MKTRKHRILCMLLTCSLLFSVTALAAGGEPEQTPAEVIQVQTEAEVQAFLADMERISALEAPALQQSTYLQSALLVDTALSEVYGGRYLDENKNLVILTTDPSAATTQAFRQAANNPNVEVRTVAYSWDELEAVYDDLDTQVMAYCEQQESYAPSDVLLSLTYIGVDEMNNQVIVRLQDLNEASEEAFRTRFDVSDAVVFKEGGHMVECATVEPGMGMSIRTTNNQWTQSSIGFFARMDNLDGTYSLGFTTAAHATYFSAVGAVVRDFTQQNTLGIYRKNNFGTIFNNTDIAFIEASYGTVFDHSVSNLTSSYYLSTNEISATSVNQGDTIYFSGVYGYRVLKANGSTGTSYSIGQDEEHQEVIEVKDVLSAEINGNYLVLLEGDSGGVAWRINGGTAEVVGTLVGKSNNVSDYYFAKVEHSCDALDLDLY